MHYAKRTTGSKFYLVLLYSSSPAIWFESSRSRFRYAAITSSVSYMRWKKGETFATVSRGLLMSVGAFCQVPKCLGMIGAEWATECFRVSFKLETDHERLLPRATAALEK